MVKPSHRWCGGEDVTVSGMSVVGAAGQLVVCVACRSEALTDAVSTLAAGVGAAVCRVGDAGPVPDRVDVVVVDDQVLEGDVPAWLEPVTASGMRVFVVLTADPSALVAKRAVRVGAHAVWQLPGDAAELVSALTEAFAPAVGRASHVAVVGLHRGAGVTSWCLALAHMMAAGRQVVVVDAHREAPHLTHRTAVSSLRGVGWDHFRAEGSVAAAGPLVEGLPRSGRLRVLGGRLPDDAVFAGAWRALSSQVDVVVSDVGAGVAAARRVAGVAGESTTSVGVTLNTHEALIEAYGQAGVAAACDVVVVRQARRGGLPPQHVGRALGAERVVAWPHDAAIQDAPGTAWPSKRSTRSVFSQVVPSGVAA